MSETNAKNNKKLKSSLKVQRVVLVVLVLALVLLGIGLFVVKGIIEDLPIEFIDPNDNKLYHIRKADGAYGLYTTNGKPCDKTDNGDYITDYGTVIIIDAESGTYTVDSGRELIYPQLFYDVYNSTGVTTYPDGKIIDRVQVDNMLGSYAFVRKEHDSFMLEGHPDVNYTQEAFAYLTTACAYPLSVMKLENPKKLPDGNIDWAEYGLLPETRMETHTDEEGNTTEKEYAYSPAKATLTVKNGEKYVLYFGDATVSGTSFYARYEGKDEVFILAGTGIADYILKGVESVISPAIVHTMTSTDYVHVRDFIIYENIDYAEIDKLVKEKFPSFDRNTATEEEISSYDKYYGELFQEYSKKLCHFSFQSTEERSESIYATLPFISFLDYSKGYYINSNNVTLMLQDLYQTSFIATEKLGPTDEELDEFGLLSADRIITYTYFYSDENGDEQEVYNKVYISKQNKDGSYYAYSDMFDMIVSVEEASFEFISWDELDWYDPSFMQYNINHVTDVVIEAENTDIHFTLDNSQSSSGTYFPIVDTTFEDSKKNSYEIKFESGIYSLFSGADKLNSVYSRDYLLLGIPFSVGQAESQDYLFYEIQETDTNGDGQNDAYICYYYGITMNDGKYCLFATVGTVNASGEPLSQAKVVIADVAYSSDCFITGGFSQYIFLLPEESSAGARLDAIYTDRGKGQWIEANIFTTAEGAYILVNPKDGMWSKLSSVSNTVYIGDKDSGKLQASGVQINTYGADEVVYPTNGNVLSYNADENKFELYDKATKTRKDATKSDIAPGIWASADFYVSNTGDLIGVSPESGEGGLFRLASSKYLASVYANGKELTYTVGSTSDLGDTQTQLAIYNFQQFYMGLLYGSFEGMCDIGEEEMAALRELDDFSGNDGRCMMKMTLNVFDLKGNKIDLVYRFYRISERRAYVTIEAIGEDGKSDSKNAYGSFYVLASYVEKLTSDANKVLSGTLVESNSKY